MEEKFLQIPIDKILTVTEARANISKLVDDVEHGDLYVLTRKGRPAAVISSVEYIMKLTQVHDSPITGKKKNNQLPAGSEKKHANTADDIENSVPDNKKI